MRGQPVGQVRSHRDDPRRVDRPVHPVVVLLDLDEVDGVPESRCLEQVPCVGPQHRHLAQLGPVALEVAVVDGIEPGQRGEQADVRLGDRVAHQIAPVRQPLAQPVQPLEQPPVGRLVRALRGREAGLVDAVVDVLVNERRDLVDLLPVPCRVQVGRTGPLVRRPLGLEVQRDPRVVVRHHRAGGDVDDGRHRDPPVVAGDGLLVGIRQPLDAEHRIPSPRIQVEGPAPLVVHRTGQRHRDYGLQAQQPPHDDRPVRPRAGPRHRQPVPPGLDRPPVPPVGGDPGVQVTGVAHERACIAHPTDTTRASLAHQARSTPTSRPAPASSSAASSQATERRR